MEYYQEKKKLMNRTCNETWQDAGIIIDGCVGQVEILGEDHEWSICKGCNPYEETKKNRGVIASNRGEWRIVTNQFQN